MLFALFLTTDLLCFVVLKLNVETVLNTDFHLEGVVHLWEVAECVHCYIMFLYDVRETTCNHDTQKVPFVCVCVCVHVCLCVCLCVCVCVCVCQLNCRR